MSNFEKYENPWKAENSGWFDRLTDTWKNSEFMPTQNDLGAVRFHSLVDAARYLGNQQIIMSSYYRYQTNLQNWFFSPNRFLDSATTRPKKFNSWDDWDSESENIRSTIAVLSGFHYEAKEVHQKDEHLKRLINGYKLWNPNLYSVFWSGLGLKGQHMCNVFVGDALYMYTKKKMLNDKDHYFSPQQLKQGKAPLKKINKDVAGPNTIAVMLDGAHVEIITSRKTFFLNAMDFAVLVLGEDLWQKQDQKSVMMVKEAVIDPEVLTEMEIYTLPYEKSN